MNAWRLVICRGQFCNMDRRGDKNLAAVEEALADRAPQDCAEVKLKTANCLSMCGAGPNAVLYPGNIAFNNLTQQGAKAIVEQYLTQPAPEEEENLY
jgi:(2Fe-2S) ferredoxin